ncbi:hypothetical protein [Micromonospora sp. CA-246542]|uniref:hypothetical protein n=1 Tax=Micromonospora sp. CA-246542 TaxID=3239959 RepID=UPI003D8FE514
MIVEGTRGCWALSLRQRRVGLYAHRPSRSASLFLGPAFINATTIYDLTHSDLVYRMPAEETANQNDVADLGLEVADQAAIVVSGLLAMAGPMRPGAGTCHDLHPDDSVRSLLRRTVHRKAR